MHFVLVCVCMCTELCEMGAPCHPAHGGYSGEVQTLFEGFLPEAKLFPSKAWQLSTKAWSVVKGKELRFWDVKEQTERINQYFRSFQ